MPVRITLTDPARCSIPPSMVTRFIPREPRPEPRLDALRVPPQSIEAEQAVLGGLMLDDRALDRVSDVLSDRDFYRRDHQLIFKAIGELSFKGKPYDAVTLGEWFESNGLAEQVGGEWRIEAVWHGRRSGLLARSIFQPRPPCRPALVPPVPVRSAMLHHTSRRLRRR